MRAFDELDVMMTILSEFAFVEDVDLYEIGVVGVEGVVVVDP